MKVSYLAIFFLLLFHMSCRTSKEIRDGRTAFESKQFAVAVDLLNTEFNNEKDDLKKAELAYLLGESYRQNNETSESVKWYDKAVELGYGPKALYEMGYGLKKLQKYGLAARYFEEILKTSDRTNEIQQEIRKCREAERLQNSGLSSEYEIELMSLNTSASEYSPYLFSDQELLFVNDNNTSSNRMYKWTGRGFSDIMLYNINTGTTSSFSDKINTAENEGAVAFNKEKTKIFFSRCYDEERDHYCKILMSELKKDKWSTPTPVFPMDPKLNYRDPVLIENDSVLIFSCDDPTGYGGTDLYYSVFENDTWSSPDLMPPSINTLGNERFPTAYNDTLFFSSDFFLGLGGLDIFKTYLRSDNSWSTPENVGIPFNSSYDDFGLIISPFVKDYVAMEGYFSSDRAGAGKDDIYYFVKRSEQKVKTEKEPEVEDETEEELEVMTILSIKVTEKSFAIENDPNSLVLGQRPVENATLIVQDSKERKTLKTDSKGNVLLEIQPDSFYQFLAGKKDYLNSKATFSMSESDITISEGVQTFNLRMEIERIFPEVEITLDNIYYDFNESFIREDAKPALNHLFQILANNPTVQIQLSSHTDCQGDDDYNDALSQRRAESAIQYIISQGIDPTRISAVGYGESRLAIECICDDCTEDEHQMNRRTTFMVVQ